jgi:hypothetical protein
MGPGAAFCILPAMADFDYTAPAELGTGRRSARGNPMKYSRLSTSAEAIRHAVEKLNANALSGAALVVDEERYGAAQIRELYDDTRYPLSRGRAPPSTSDDQDVPEAAIYGWNGKDSGRGRPGTVARMVKFQRSEQRRTPVVVFGELVPTN